MRKKITSIVMALFFTVGLTGVSLAAKCKGEVVKNENGQLVIKLKDECKAKAGDAVKIKVKAASKVEGC
ncbi:MAG: hypothetical protein GXO58_01840 [Thermodesulfobacteria bacterium]|nr:hypothetical protein [Thermodesulfobacteriota bacterium]